MAIAFVVFCVWMMLATILGEVAGINPGASLAIVAAVAVIAFVFKFCWLLYMANKPHISTRLACDCEDDAREQLKNIYDKEFPKMTELEKHIKIRDFIKTCYADGTFPKEWREE